MNYNRTNFIQISSAKGLSVNYVTGIEIVKRNGTTLYYIADRNNNRILIYNESWSFVSSKSIFNPTCILNYGDYFYITSLFALFKTDLNLNILIRVNSSYIVYGIDYDPANNVFICTKIDDLIKQKGLYYYYNENLTLLYSYSLKNETPFGHYSIKIFNGLIYSAAYGGQLEVFNNTTVINRFQMCTSGLFTNAIIYLDRYILVSCNSDTSVKLFHINGTSTGFSFTGFFDNWDAKYTENNELIVTDRHYFYIFKL